MTDTNKQSCVVAAATSEPQGNESVARSSPCAFTHHRGDPPSEIERITVVPLLIGGRSNQCLVVPIRVLRCYPATTYYDDIRDTSPRGEALDARPPRTPLPVLLLALPCKPSNEELNAINQPNPRRSRAGLALGGGWLGAGLGGLVSSFEVS